MALTYDETALVLALLDNAPGRDLDLRMSDLHLSVQAWPEPVVASAISSERPVSSPLQPSPAPNDHHSLSALELVISPVLGFCVAVDAAIGEHIGEGQSLALIEDAIGERMAVTALVAGRVREVDIRKGDFVEFGQVLAMIEHDGAATAPIGTGEKRYA